MKKCSKWLYVSVVAVCFVSAMIFLTVVVLKYPDYNIEGFSTSKTTISFLSRFSARLSAFADPLLSPTPLVIGNMSFPSPLMSMIGSFTPAEMVFRTGMSGKLTSIQATSLYSKYLLDFASTEQSRIKSLILSTTELPKNQWIFIKKADILDGGESFILGNNVCLSQKDTSTLAADAPQDDEETDDRLMLLLSMLIYKTIKNDPKTYEKFYVQLGFNAILNLNIPTDLQANRYSDPNVPVGEWSFGLEGTNYWSTRVIRDNTIKTETYVISKTGDAYQVTMPAVDSSIVCQGLGVDDSSKIHHPACILTLNPMILHANDTQPPDETDDQPMTI